MDQAVKKRKTYPTSEQKVQLRRLVEADVELRSGKFSATFTKQTAQMRWAAIARQVNSLAGAKKTWLEWRKTWQDMHSKAKKRQAELRRIRLSGRFGSPDPLSASDHMPLRSAYGSSPLGHNDSHDSHQGGKNFVMLTPETTAALSDRKINKFPKQEISSPLQSEEDTSEQPKRKPMTQKTLAKSFLSAIALIKEKNDYKKQFYDDYLTEMRRQTDALLQIANNIAKISDNSHNTNNTSTSANISNTSSNIHSTSPNTSKE